MQEKLPELTLHCDGLFDGWSVGVDELLLGEDIPGFPGTPDRRWFTYLKDPQGGCYDHIALHWTRAEAETEMLVIVKLMWRGKLPFEDKSLWNRRGGC